MSLFERIMDTNRSFMRMPIWVRLWILLLLGPVNLAAFFLTYMPTGYWAAWATVAVLVLNSLILFYQRGWGKALAMPHLIVWIPLLIFIAQRFSAADMTGGEWVYAVLLFVINGISILFDINDTRLWLQGERAVA